MFCKNCGVKFEDGTKFCPECGTPVEGNTARLKHNISKNKTSLINIDKNKVNQIISTVGAKTKSVLRLIKKYSVIGWNKGTKGIMKGLNCILTAYKTNKKLRIGSLCGAVLLILIVGGTTLFYNIAKNSDSNTSSNSNFFTDIFEPKRKNGLQFSTEYKPVDYSNNYIIATTSNELLYGVLNLDGEVVIPFEYDEIKFVDKNNKYDCFVAKYENKFGVINSKNKDIIPIQYDEIVYSTDFDRFCSIEKNIYSTVNNGKVIIEYIKPSFTFYNSSGEQLSSIKISGDSLSGWFLYWWSDSIVVIEGRHSKYTNALYSYSSLKMVNINSSEILYNKDVNIEEQTVIGVRQLVSDHSYYEITYYSNYYSKSIQQNKIYYDNQGNEVSKINLKNSKGKKIATVNPQDYSYITKLDETGWCLVKSTEKGTGSQYNYRYSIKNLANGTTSCNFYDYSYDKTNNVLIIYKATSWVDTTYAGTKISYVEDKDVIAVDYKGNQLYYYGNVGVSQKFSGCILINSNGTEKLIDYNGNFKGAERYYDYCNLIDENGIIYGLLKNESDEWCMLNSTGDVIVDYGIFGENTSTSNLLYASDGVLYISGSDIYWYSSNPDNINNN